jgi:hypothetical protein
MLQISALGLQTEEFCGDVRKSVCVGEEGLLVTLIVSKLAYKFPSVDES